MLLTKIHSRLPLQIGGVLLWVTLLMPFQGKAGGCYNGIENCDWSSLAQSRSNSQSSTTGGKVKINPAAVPTNDGFGLESILFKSDADLGIVRGNGRIGAAISPTNSEETFFGPPGFSHDQDLLERKQESEKYPSQKVSLATAISLVENQRSTFNSYSLKFGVMGRYNRLTKNVNPGVGISGTLGPMSFGASVYNDETVLSENIPSNDGLRPLYTYKVSTYSVGFFLSSLLLDYSHLQLDTNELAEVSLYTASVFVKKFIFTASRRVEKSFMPAYNYETRSLENKEIKEDVFGGIQYSLSKNFIMGALYNYYLLREYSLTATLLF